MKDIKYFKEEVRQELVEYETKNWTYGFLSIPPLIMALSSLNPISGAVVGTAVTTKSLYLMLKGDRTDKIIGSVLMTSGVALALGSLAGSFIPFWVGAGVYSYYTIKSTIYYVKSMFSAKKYGLDIADFRREQDRLHFTFARDAKNAIKNRFGKNKIKPQNNISV